MGCSYSTISEPKHKSRKSEGVEIKTDMQENTQPEQPYKIYDPDQYDQATINYLKEGFKNDTETFILNQLLMSYMFFNDYTEDIRHCATTTPENKKLIREYQKELILPDTILKTVCQKFKYKPSEGPKRNQILPLTSERMYVIHNNVEIEDPRANPANYSIIDKPCYQAKIEEKHGPKDPKGFVKIIMLSPNETRSSFGSVYTESSEEKPEIDRNVDSTPSTSTGIMHNDSGFNTESDYDYASITAAKTPQKLNMIDSDIYSNTCQVPSKCFTSVRIKNINAYDFTCESEEEDEEDNNAPIQSPALFLTNTYLNSQEFMLHFKNLFPNYLGEALDFPIPFIERATSLAGSIFCNNIDECNNIMQYEVIPAVATSWPYSIAFEWPNRERTKVHDKRTGTTYEWPTKKMIEEAALLQCVLIPRGFMPKRGNNNKIDIEWEAGFPKTERYLELRMSQAQMCVFLFLIIIHRTLIEPKTKRYGLLVEHIRYLMFWECEANYKDWPQDKLGIKLKRILKNLYNHLSKSNLPHYFIKEKNVLENVPNKFIFETLEDIMQILDAPVIHMLTALKDIKYHATEEFYPEPDLDALYKIISAKISYDDNVILSIMSYENVKKKETQNDENIKRDKEHEWNRRFLEVKRQNNARKLTKKNVDTKYQHSNPISAGLEVPIQTSFQDDTARQIKLLTFFIEHFIKIAERSFKVSSSSQTMLYLKQAWYLTKLLEDIDIGNAIDFQQQIKKIEENWQKRKVNEPTVPDTPRRNTYNNNEIIQVKGKDINMTNLSKSYNENLYIKATTKKKGKKTPTLEPKVKVIPVQIYTDNNDNIVQESPTISTETVNNKSEESTPPNVTEHKTSPVSESVYNMNEEIQGISSRPISIQQKTSPFSETVSNKSEEIECTSL